MTAQAMTHYPLDFASWPRNQQIDWVASSFYRSGLIAHNLAAAGIDVDAAEVDTNTKLTKKELAAIHLELEGIAHSGGES